MEKKVLVVITTGFVSWGGLTNAFMNHYRKMDMNGLCIDVASMNEPDLDLVEELSKNKGKYHRLPDKRRNTVQYLKQFFMLCKGYDVVHVHGNSSTMAAELILAKVQGVDIRIAHCHTNKCMHPIMNWLCSPFLLYAQTIGLAVSDEAAWVYKKCRYTVLQNTIDTTKYEFNENSRKRIRKAYGISNDEVVIGHCGKFYEAKNHKFLLEVFAKIYKEKSNVRLLLVGDGVLRNQIEKQAKELGINSAVIFTGMQNDTSFFYSAMDFFLLPSLYEGFGLVLLEAQAAGLDCLVSDNVPRRTSVTDNVMILKLDVDLWRKMFIENYHSYDRKKRSIQDIERIVQKGYDSSTVAQKLKDIYLGKII